MASAWGEVGTFVNRWYGSGVISNSRINILPPAPVPVPFNPSTDVSGLAFWLDANDSSTVDVSGTNVLSWTEKAYGVDVYPCVDLSNCPQYGVHTMNFLNVVYFPLNSALRDSETVLDFNDRTCFVVCKPLAFDIGLDISGSAFLNFYHGDATADMQLGLRYYDVSGFTTYSICSNGINCGVQFDISGSPLNTKMILAWRQSSGDLSGNAGWYDTSGQPLANSELSTFNPDGQYTISDDTKNQSLDMAELLIYNGVLSDENVYKILDYLSDKWNLSGPGIFPAPQAVAPPEEPPLFVEPE